MERSGAWSPVVRVFGFRHLFGIMRSFYLIRQPQTIYAVSRAQRAVYKGRVQAHSMVSRRDKFEH